MQNSSRSNQASSTPVRAITSTLSARSAPSIPPASQTYEPLVKAVLRHRLLYSILLPAFAYSWLLANAWSVWSQGGLSHLGIWKTLVNSILPFTWVYAVAIWILGVLPAIIQRNRYLTVTPTAASSPSKMFHAAITRRSTSSALLTYIASSLLLALVHILMAYTYEPSVGGNPRLHLFVKSKKHPYYLNGRVVYLLSSQITLALGYLLRTILLDRFTVRWSNVLASPVNHNVPYFRLGRILTTSVTVTIFTALCCAVHTILFGFARSILLPLFYSLPFVPRVLGPFTAHFLRGPWTFTLIIRHWSLLCRALLLSLTTVACWECSESPLDDPVAVSHTTADPALTLVSGITSADGYFKYFAYAELKQFASEVSPVASARRSALFADQKYNPSMWACLVRDALLMLGKDYQLLLRRGKPENPAAAPAAVPKASTPLPATPMRLIRAPIVKPSPASPFRAALDTLASDGPLSNAVTLTAETGASHIPELFRSVVHANPSAEKAVEAAKKGEERVVGLLERTKGRWREVFKTNVQKHLPRPVTEAVSEVADWWRRERVNKAVETYLPNRHLDALAVSALSHLVCASLTEDRYGIVQRDIPKVIEALLSFLTAIEECQVEVNAMCPPLSQEDLQNLSPKESAARERLTIEVSRAGDVLTEVGDALKEGIVQIARTFGDKLAAFKFSPRTAQKLQGFVDYA